MHPPAPQSTPSFCFVAHSITSKWALVVGCHLHSASDTPLGVIDFSGPWSPLEEGEARGKAAGHMWSSGCLSFFAVCRALQRRPNKELLHRPPSTPRTWMGFTQGELTCAQRLMGLHCYSNHTAKPRQGWGQGGKESARDKHMAGQVLPSSLLACIMTPLMGVGANYSSRGRGVTGGRAIVHTPRRLYSKQETRHPPGWRNEWSV